MENGTVEQELPAETGVESVASEGATSGQEEAGAGAPQIDPAVYEKLTAEHGQLSTNWSKIEQLANADPVFRKELERAWKGLPAQVAKVQEQPKPQGAEKPKTNAELQQLNERLTRFEQAQMVQQQESLRREKFSEVQSETADVAKRYNASEPVMNEFWKRYGDMIRTETFNTMQNNPGIAPNVAMQQAYSRHDKNLAGEFALLMEDHLMGFYGDKIKERTNPLKGIGSPAEKAGKAGAGVLPDLKERFFSAMKKERNPERRAEMIKAFSEQSGISVDNIFRSSGG